MIISHKFKFIFIKTVKTAGTSVEVDLNKVLGESDVATPIFPVVSGHKAQNFEFKKFGIFTKRFRNHMGAADVKKIVGSRTFSDYFVFCVEREPLDKCISHYSMIKNSPDHNSGNENLSWNDYVEMKKFPVDTGKYTDKHGALIVDKILKYENLSEELSAVGEMLGFNLDLKAKAKAGFRQDIDVSERHKRAIYDAFSSSNQFTGYSL